MFAPYGPSSQEAVAEVSHFEQQNHAGVWGGYEKTNIMTLILVFLLHL